MKKQQITLLPAERLSEITASVARKGSARVIDLAKKFNVTDETIRRDLEKLEAEGKLRRSHGGAVALNEAGIETSFADRKDSYQKEKIAIAEAALETIEEGDTILLDPSSTVWQLARRLPNIPLTVITNAIQNVTTLADRPHIRVICIGGALSAPSLSFVGPAAESMLKQYRVKKLYMSCKGIDLDRGLSESNEWQALLKGKMMDLASQTYLLADHSKFGQNALASFGNIPKIYKLITDSGTDKYTISKFKNMGVEVQVIPA